MKNDVKTTRLELIKTKARRRVAAKGLSLLKMKRSSLILEFFKLARTITLLRANLNEHVLRAMDSTKIAEAQAGRANLERIAVEQKMERVSVDVRNVMGVRIPSLDMESTIKRSDAYELISVPSSVEDARKNYSTLLKLLIEIAEKENSLRKLLHEIEKLNRRANAIENVVMPDLDAKASYIKQRLEDIERDQTVSLKFIKRKIGNAG